MALNQRIVNDGCKCPSCGQPVSSSRLLVDLNSNTILYQGHQWRVSPKLSEFAFALMTAWPRVISDVDLRSALWGIDGDDKSGTQLSIYAHHLRMMLLPFGSQVERVQSRGYRLILNAEATALAA